MTLFPWKMNFRLLIQHYARLIVRVPVCRKIYKVDCGAHCAMTFFARLVRNAAVPASG
jgi:hypothetical protein